MQDAGALVLLVVINLEVCEHRLYVAAHIAIFNVDLREHGELASRHVESPVGTQNIIHGGQVRVLDRDIQVESGSVWAGKKITRHVGIAAAHELAPKCQIRPPLLLMIGKILERDVSVTEK